MNNSAAVQNLNDTEANAPVVTETPGSYLRMLRKKADLSQSQVAESLHLTVHYVNALENDEYQKLPGKIFVKGYLKSYAVLLDAKPEFIVTRFETLCEQRNEFPQNLNRTQSRYRNHRYGAIWFIVAALLLVGIVVASWYFWSGSQDTSQTVRQGLVPDYLNAATNETREVILTIPVGNQIYTVRSPGNSVLSNNTLDAVEKTPEQDSHVQPDPERNNNNKQLPPSSESNLPLDG